MTDLLFYTEIPCCRQKSAVCTLKFKKNVQNLYDLTEKPIEPIDAYWQPIDPVNRGLGGDFGAGVCILCGKYRNDGGTAQ